MSSNARRASRPNTCSAFSAHAREGEDWTQETDPGVRRQWQNRIAQRKNRAKNKGEKDKENEEKKQMKHQRQAKKQKKRAAATSPLSNNSLLSGTSSSSMTQERSPSTGTGTNAAFSPPQQMDLFQRLLPNQDVPAHGNPLPTSTQTYWNQPMTPAPIAATFAGFTQPLPAPGIEYAQFTTHSDFQSQSVPFISPTHPNQYAIASSPTTTTSGHSITPTTPLSQGGYLAVNDGPPYCFGYPQAYANPEVASSQAYTDPAASVYVPHCFAPNYPPS